VSSSIILFYAQTYTSIHITSFVVVVKTVDGGCGAPVVRFEILPQILWPFARSHFGRGALQMTVFFGGRKSVFVLQVTAMMWVAVAEAVVVVVAAALGGPLEVGLVGRSRKLQGRGIVFFR